MLILNWAQDMLTGNVSGILGKILRTIFLWLDSVIYGVIGWLYKLFTLLSEVRLFENDQMRQLQSRIYIVIGVISLFLVSYSLLNAIINPDNATKGKNNSVTGIVKNIILAVIGIAIVPTCFDYAYEFQRRVLCSNVITNLFLVEDPEEDTMIKDFGTEMSLTLFQSFYYAQQLSSDGLTYEPIVYDSSEASDWKTVASAITDDDNKTNFAEAIENIKSGKSSIFEALGNFDKAFENHQLGYFLIISTIAGAYCAYVLLGFVIDISIRAVKLSYLQIIAPLPIFTLVIPNQKKVFDSWLKKTTACFMEVFVRVIAITFAAFAVKYLPLWIFSWGGIGSGMSQLCGETVTKGLIVFARAAFIIGIFGFLKQAPKFISDLLPGFDSKGFKLGFGNAFAEAGGFRALGAAGGAITGGVRNFTAAGQKNWQQAGEAFRNGRWRDFAKNTGAGVAKGLLHTPSVVAGASSGGARSFIKGKDAKKWSDSVKFAGEGADAAMEAKFKREDYKQAHGGKPWSAPIAHVKDVFDTVTDYPNSHRANFNYENKKHQAIDAIIKADDAVGDKAKALMNKYDNKVEYEGKTLSEIRKDEEIANSDLNGLVQERARLKANGINTQRVDAEIESLKKKAIAAHQNTIKAEKDITGQIRRGDYSGNFKPEENAALENLYVKYAKTLEDNISSLSGNQAAYATANQILEDAKTGNFRTILEGISRPDPSNPNKKIVDGKSNLMDNVKIADSEVVERMNREGEAVKQQESKK